MMIKGILLNLILFGFPTFLIKQLNYPVLSISIGSESILLSGETYNYLKMALVAIPLKSNGIDGLEALKSLHGEHEAECDCEDSDCRKCHRGHKGHHKHKLFLK